MILVIARTDYQQLGVAQRSVLQAMPISNAGLESRTVSRLQCFLAFIGDKHDFALEHVHKFVFMRVPMALS